jgi:hypothetical protein
MRFKTLLLDGQKITSSKKIAEILDQKKFHWLIDSTVVDAEIELKNNTLIWHNGTFNGDWHYGIFKNGTFYGTFENGIWEDGNFKGKFLSGIRT